MAALPIHPTKRHPLTGEPLEAIWVTPRGRVCWPIMGGDDTVPPADPPPGDTPPPEFPANTPVVDMQVAEQAAYWRDKARKHEGRVKALGDLTPDALAALREKADRQDALEDELASDKDRAVKEAKTVAQSEADARYRPLLAETAFRVAIGDRKPEAEVDEFIDDLNLTRFLTDDGKVDTAKVLSRVEQFAPATGTRQDQQTHRRGPSPTGQGNRGGNRTGEGDRSVDAGRELYRAGRKK